MSAIPITFHKVTALPATLQANAIYVVNDGTGVVRYYTTDQSGTAALPASSDVLVNVLLANQTLIVTRLASMQAQLVAHGLVESMDLTESQAWDILMEQ